MTDAVEPGGAASAAPAEVPSVGETLARARCSVGLSVEDVARQLKYSALQIELLEKDGFAKLPAGAFARGMLRGYARLLKLDPEPLIRRIAGSVASAPEVDDAVSFRKPTPFSDSARHVNLRYALLSIAVLGVMAAVALGWPGRSFDDSQLTFVPASRGPAVAAAPIGTEHAPVGAVGTPLAAVMPTQVASETAAAVAPGTRSPGGARRITLRFDRAAWVEVRGGDGRVLTSEINAAGTTRTVDGAAPFHLVIGNALHVRLNYGEQSIDLSRHARQDVARLTLE